MKYFLILLSIVSMRTCMDQSKRQLMLDLESNSLNMKDINGLYKVIKLNHEDISSFNININFDKKTQKISGFSGCNKFFGSYSQLKNKLSFSEIGSTKMLCNEEKNNLENLLLKALKKANLILFNDKGFSLYQNKKLLLIGKKEQSMAQDISFEYSAFSRNVYNVIKLNKKSIYVQKDKKSKAFNTTCSKEQWDKVLKLCNDIDFKNISNLKAPTQKRLYDGAAIAKLKVTLDGKIYETSAFDHGDPHPDIANLVKEILSLAQNIE